MLKMKVMSRPESKLLITLKLLYLEPKHLSINMVKGFCMVNSIAHCLRMSFLKENKVDSNKDHLVPEIMIKFMDALLMG